MGTRAAIARPDNAHEAAFRGVYHHWDGYPSGLGATLWARWRDTFGSDTDRMMAFPVDAHPAGWITINGADMTAEPGFEENGFHRAGPNCYCHGGRHEDAWVVTQDDAAGSGVEWVYVLDGPIMHVLSSRTASGAKMIGMFGSGDPDARWVGVARINLADPTEPDWPAIEARG